MTPQLCSVCEGNGVVKIPGGVSTCDHCDGKCYEPAPDWRARVLALIKKWRAEASSELGKATMHGRGTPEHDEHMELCRAWKSAADELDALVRATPDREDV